MAKAGSRSLELTAGCLHRASRPAPKRAGLPRSWIADPRGASMTDARALRHQLHAAGYCPIPLYGKEPPIYGKNNKRKGLGGWQELRDITREMIDMWAKIWPDAANTGCLTRL